MLDIAQTKNKHQKIEKLMSFFKRYFPEIEIDALKINSSPLSLNSLNGFVFLKNGQELFFKFHTEEGEEMIDEYYNFEVLKKAGFPCLEAVAVRTFPRSQMVLYPKIEAKTLYELWADAEEKNDPDKLKKLLAAEKQFCEKISALQLKSLKVASHEDILKQPIQLLFYGRLHNRRNMARVDLFYQDKIILLPDGSQIAPNDFFNLRFEINGRCYDESLAQLIDKSKSLLNPRNLDSAVITAHGDDHNGNKFYDNGEIIYFDPAFAGNCIPALLANIKSTFHDVYAHRFWVYEPKRADLSYELDFRLKKGKISITHNWRLPESRKKLMEIRAAHLWKPLLSALKKQDLLQVNYRDFIKKALFSCPLLVKNLIDYNQISTKISLLSWCVCMELGGNSRRSSFLDDFLTSLI